MIKRSTLIGLLAAGVVARLAVLALPGTGDAPDWKATSYVASSDFLNIYGAGGSPPEQRKLHWQRISATTEYPPVSHVELALVGRLYRHIDPTFGDSATLTALIKLPGLLAEVLLVWWLLTGGRRLMGDAAATWTALAFWLNPAVWLAGPVLCYLDAQMAIPATLALIAATARRPRLAGFLAAVATLTKPQALFMAPVLIAVLLRDDDRWHWKATLSAAVAAFIVALVAFVPFVAAGTWPSLVRAFQRFGEHDLVSGTATNAWWIITWAAGSAARLRELGWWQALTRPATMVRISTVVGMGLPNPRTLGTVLTLAAFGWAGWRARHGLRQPAAALLGGWCVLAYFNLSGQVHENHAYLALPLLAVAAGEVPAWRPLYWATSAAFFLNLYVFYGFGSAWPSLINRQWTGVDLTILLSLAYVAITVWATILAAQASSPAAAVNAAGTSSERPAARA